MRILVASLVAMGIGWGLADEARAGVQSRDKLRLADCHGRLRGRFDRRSADSTGAPLRSTARTLLIGAGIITRNVTARPYGTYYRGVYGPRPAYPVVPYPVSPYPVPAYPAPVYPPAYAAPSGGSSFGLYIGF